jgi:hypothetical protein
LRKERKAKQREEVRNTLQLYTGLAVRKFSRSNKVNRYKVSLSKKAEGRKEMW